jgi:polynucleotide 5'-kinase involved in rRNA processing
MEVGASTVVFDTCGLVDPRQGGLALKVALIDLLQPRSIYAIQRDQEIEPLLIYLRRSRRSEVHVLAPAEMAVSRSMNTRQHNRARQFEAYFADAKVQWLDWRRYGIYPAPRFALGRLLALEDPEGFVLALSIIVDIDRKERRLAVLSPEVDVKQASVLYLGDVLVDRQTWSDKPIEK